MINRELDQFFTTKEIANNCLKFLTANIDVLDADWIEPSAGAGVFLNEARNVGMKKHLAAFDLMLQAPDIEAQDFLKTDLSIIFNPNAKRLCLGNPPFGKNSSLAVKFFNHAAPHCTVIAMIFPATFSKESVQKKLDKSFHLKAESMLGDTPFSFIDEIRMVPVVFQIWEKKDVLRDDKKSKLKSEHFNFVKKNECDFAIQRVGTAAGRVKEDVENLATASHYFIKENTVGVKDTFRNIDWTSIKLKNAGNPSIAKTELIRELEKYLVH